MMRLRHRGHNSRGAPYSCAGATFCRESPGVTRQDRRIPARARVRQGWKPHPITSASEENHHRENSILAISGPDMDSGALAGNPTQCFQSTEGGWVEGQAKKFGGRGRGFPRGIALRPSGGDPPGGSLQGDAVPPTRRGRSRVRPRGNGRSCLRGRRAAATLFTSRRLILELVSTHEVHLHGSPAASSGVCRTARRGPLRQVGTHRRLHSRPRVVPVLVHLGRPLSP